MAGRDPTPCEFLDAAREMATTGRPVLARLLAEDAADRTPDPREAARIRRLFPQQPKED
ncbi:hypothetical protein [Streptomyces hainanensis]|uniref:hypothetical protein n=1 Tax=Streptomyces hainanensis TaxID=402648 RepID=UPI0014042AE9|nr:hypothetical protein [Streptomyces hainanensis]